MVDIANAGAAATLATAPTAFETFGWSCRRCRCCGLSHECRNGEYVCVCTVGGRGKQRSVCVTPVKDNGGVRWVNVVVVVVVAVSFCCGCGNGRSVGVAMCINATQQAKMHVCH